ncbi:hypothetical protein [Carboxylicivirga linearis]|uniref:Uncharacterized protein n=1 Tax=Carboxylicivirga linearis TaxID=1628157 RepID=A0ABS5JUG6_9BACT|nr:hypothetical protein [Carboxylicivirga linearis]MBS2098116.1 hypothetical protein [Carboxylicivirga linearis]
MDFALRTSNFSLNNLTSQIKHPTSRAISIWFRRWGTRRMNEGREKFGWELSSLNFYRNEFVAGHRGAMAAFFGPFCS